MNAPRTFFARAVRSSATCGVPTRTRRRGGAEWEAATGRDVGREERGLVVAALADTRHVRDHGNDDIDRDAARQIGRDTPGHQRAELGGERALAAVLEAVDRPAQRTSVRPGSVDAPTPLRLAGLAAVEAEPRSGRVAARATRCEEQV